MEATPPIQPLPGPGPGAPQAVREEWSVDQERPPAKLCFVDVETTGLDPSRHEVYEIGLILAGAEEDVAERHWWLAIDLSRADSDALRISGYYDRHPIGRGDAEDIEHTADVVAHNVARLTAGAHLAGVNPAFDATFLGAFLRAQGQVPTWHYHLIDVLPLVAGFHRLRPPWESRELSSAIGVDPPSGADRHTALGDARWAKRMYEAVMGAS